MVIDGTEQAPLFLRKWDYWTEQTLDALVVPGIRLRVSGGLTFEAPSALHDHVAWQWA